MIPPRVGWTDNERAECRRRHGHRHPLGNLWRRRRNGLDKFLRRRRRRNLAQRALLRRGGGAVLRPGELGFGPIPGRTLGHHGHEAFGSRNARDGRSDAEIGSDRTAVRRQLRRTRQPRTGISGAGVGPQSVSRGGHVRLHSSGVRCGMTVQERSFTSLAKGSRSTPTRRTRAPGKTINSKLRFRNQLKTLIRLE